MRGEGARRVYEKNHRVQDWPPCRRGEKEAVWRPRGLWEK